MFIVAGEIAGVNGGRRGASFSTRKNLEKDLHKNYFDVIIKIINSLNKKIRGFLNESGSEFPLQT